MIQNILKGICNALDQEFGDVYEIHIDTIKQDLKEPCFLIRCVGQNSKLMRGGSYFRTHKFCVHYFPRLEQEQVECMVTLERLYVCLELIALGENETTYGSKMSGEIVDGMLHFFVNYDMYALKEMKKEVEMDQVDVQTDMKKGME